MRGFAERDLEWKMAATAVFLLDDELLFHALEHDVAGGGPVRKGGAA